LFGSIGKLKIVLIIFIRPKHIPVKVFWVYTRIRYRLFARRKFPRIIVKFTVLFRWNLSVMFLSHDLEEISINHYAGSRLPENAD
jgi:hypothetical protein